MAYTTPATYSVAQILTAANLNTYLRDNVSWLATDAPHARVFNSAGGAIADVTDTALQFNTERVDVGNMWTSGANTRLTVPTGGGGFYMIHGSNQWAASASGYRALAIRLNGTTAIARVVVGGQNALQEQNVTALYQLAVGDYVELVVYQNTGGNLNVNSSGNTSPEFAAAWLFT